MAVNKQLKQEILNTENNYIKAVRKYSKCKNNEKQIVFYRAKLHRLYNLAGYTYNMRIINDNCFGTEVK